MARKIETLLRVMSDMQRFEDGDMSTQRRTLQFAPNELSEEELDMVVAAAQEPSIPEFLKKENQ